MTDLGGCMVALLACDGFEQASLLHILSCLSEHDATVLLVAPSEGRIRGWDEADWADEIEVDVDLASAEPAAFHALVIPDGGHAVQPLQADPRVLTLLRGLAAAGRPIAALGSGVSLLIAAGLVQGRRIAAPADLQPDLLVGGADWIDAEAVIDLGLVTARGQGDLGAFCEALIQLLSQQKSGRRRKPLPSQPG